MARHTGRRIRIDAANKAMQEAQQHSSQTAETPDAGADRPLPPPPRLQRLFRLLHCLQARSMFTCPELATALKVSRRTVYRDISLLRDAGIDVHLDPDTAGYSLSHDFNLRLQRLDEDELALLGLTVRLSLVHVVPELAAAVQQTLAKLLASQDTRTQKKVGRVLSKCKLKLSGLSPRPIAGAVVPEICRAMQARRRIRVTLIGPEREPLRQVKMSPYQIVVGIKRWELVGRSWVDKKIVRIDLAQIQRVEQTDDEFDVPVGFHSHYPPAATDGSMLGSTGKQTN